MKNILLNVLNWFKQLSNTKKVFVVFGMFCFGFPVLLFILMFLFMFTPYIATIAAIALLVLSFIKKQDAKSYWISSVIALGIAFVSVFVVNNFMVEDNGKQNDAVVVEDEGDSASPVIQENSSEAKDEIEEVVAPVIYEGKIHFINTGNSDAILIENDGKFAMIDTGNTDDDETVKNYLKNQGVEKLDYLILTHFHADHIGGADTVISDFEVKTTLVPNGDADTQVYQDYINALSTKGLKPSVPLEGAEFELGSAKLTIYNTEGGSSNENNNSLVVLYENGQDKALFMGDAESEVENKLSIGDIDLLKVGHHGSNSSTSESFINNVQPEYAVILVGQPNQYGHPHQETLNLLKNKGILVYRTDEQGDIIFVSSGDGLKTELNAGSYNAGQSKEEKPSTPQGQSESSEETSSSNNSNNSSGGYSSSSNDSNNSSSGYSSSSNTNEGNSSNSTPNYKDDNPGGVYNQESTGQTESYQNCTLLREVYPNGVPEGHPAYAPKHDRDKDGWACER